MAHALETSNTTSNHFLGTVQRVWMQPGTQTSPDISRPPPFSPTSRRAFGADNIPEPETVYERSAADGRNLEQLKDKQHMRPSFVPTGAQDLQEKQTVTPYNVHNAREEGSRMVHDREGQLGSESELDAVGSLTGVGPALLSPPQTVIEARTRPHSTSPSTIPLPSPIVSIATQGGPAYFQPVTAGDSLSMPIVVDDELLTNVEPVAIPQASRMATATSEFPIIQPNLSTNFNHPPSARAQINFHGGRPAEEQISSTAKRPRISDHVMSSAFQGTSDIAMRHVPQNQESSSVSSGPLIRRQNGGAVERHTMPSTGIPQQAHAMPDRPLQRSSLTGAHASSPIGVMTGTSSVAQVIAVHLQQFDVAVDQFRRRLGPMLDTPLFRGRVLLVQRACKSGDLFFLLAHQLFCLWTLNQMWMQTALGFNASHAQGFHYLGNILHPNAAIPLEVLNYFARFLNPFHVLEHDPSVRQWIGNVKDFLHNFEQRWDTLRLACSNGLPPSPRVIAYHQRCQTSVVFQQVFFNSLARQLYPAASEALREDLRNAFEENLAVYLRSLTTNTINIAQYLSREPDVRLFDSQIKQQFLRHQYFVQPQMQILNQIQTHTQGLQRPQNPPMNDFGMGVIRGLTTTQLSRPPPTPEAPAPNITPAGFVPRPQSGNAQPIRASNNTPTLYTPLIPSTTVPLQHQSVNRMIPHPAVTQPISGQPMPSPIRPAPQSSQPQNISMTVSEIRTGQQARTPTASFFPRLGQRLPVATNPRPDRIALHQSRLQTPPPDATSSVNDSAPEHRMYAFMERFVMAPKRLDQSSTFQQHKIEVQGDVLSRRVADTLPEPSDPFGRAKRDYHDQSIIIHLRCVSLLANQEIDENSQSAWVSQRTAWPETAFFSLNGQHLELRRKVQHRTDLAVDITRLLHVTRNELTISYFPSKAEKEKGLVFAVAIEAQVVMTYERVIKLPIPLESANSLEQITSVLRARNDHFDNGDDEIVVADSFLSIDLADPNSSRIVGKAVRGKSCPHRDCFDLETFLQSLISRNKTSLISAEQWKCPICKSDARPTSLIVDGFLNDVIEVLRRQGRSDVKAILVKEDGSWTPRSDKTAPIKQIKGLQQPPKTPTIIQNTNSDTALPLMRAEDHHNTVQQLESTTPAERTVIDLEDDNSDSIS